MIPHQFFYLTVVLGLLWIFCMLHIPTVSLGVTSVMVYTYGRDDGRIAPTRCAVIDAGLGDRWSPRRACGIPPAAAGSGRIVPVVGLRPVSTAAPGGSPRSRTTPPSATTPCDDASLAKWVGSGRVTLRHVSPMPGSRAGLLPSSPLRTARESFPSSSSSLANAPCGTRSCHVQHVL